MHRVHRGRISGGAAEAVEALAGRLARGHDVRLICHCAPARCHGDDIARVASERAREIWNRAKRQRWR